MSSIEVRKRKIKASDNDREDPQNTLHNERSNNTTSISSLGDDECSKTNNITSVTWRCHRVMIITIVMMLLLINYELSLLSTMSDNSNISSILLVKEDDIDILPTILKGLLNKQLMTGVSPFHFQFHPSPLSLSMLSYYPKFDIQDMLSPYEENIQQGNINENKNDNNENGIHRILSDAKTKSDVKEYRDENEHMILTRRGYKGGPINEQVNQDRAIIIKHPTLAILANKQKNSLMSIKMAIGIFDGHGSSGHLVAQFVQQYLPIVLSKNMNSVLKNGSSSEAMTQAIVEAFQTVDRKLPRDIGTQAGSTASMIIQTYSDTIYTANVGDSECFIFAYDKISQSIYLVYQTKKHKPDLSEERKRIESSGGTVEIPSQKEEIIHGKIMEISSRVVVPITTGGTASIAMSRCMGDIDGRKVGLISVPTVDVLSIQSLKKEAKNQSKLDNSLGDIELFAVAASDGLLDFIKPIEVGKQLARSLYYDKRNGKNPSQRLQNACEKVILESSSIWQSFGMRYRDDITIAVSKIDVRK